MILEMLIVIQYFTKILFNFALFVDFIKKNVFILISYTIDIKIRFMIQNFLVVS